MSELTAHASAEFSPAEGEVDDSRRKFLLRTTIGVGAVGVAFTATPFIESWLPSERARALGGPTDVDVSKIDAGQMIITLWRRQPIYVTRRTPAMMKDLGNHNDRLKDPTSADSDQPEYCKNPIRSRNAEYLVLIGICTHLGCLPKQFFDAGDPVLGADWPGGWRCPCHGSRFDLAGRVFDGSPASVNLRIPPYSYPNPAKLVIGEDTGAAGTETAAT
ncbi:MAG TPA: ubiquinol-cytochrome c reductase iron-sulfur subunit [Steroidobacteraceae bacterium]|jgi:ubiquinol-cytochrome c reductase iron-sulfur subunit